MRAQALISELSDRGITIRPNGPNVALSPKRHLTPALLDRVKREKTQLIRGLEKVRKEAGIDWNQIASDPQQLKVFYELMMITEMRDMGIVPDHYTATTECKHCGPVPIFEGLPNTVEGCPCVSTGYWDCLYLPLEIELNEIRSGVNQDRDPSGRFTPGSSGNPTGRPVGIMDKRTTKKVELLAPILPEAIEKLHTAVSEGERWAIELVVTYSIPRPKPVDPEELEAFEQRLSELETGLGRH